MKEKNTVSGFTKSLTRQSQKRASTLSQSLWSLLEEEVQLLTQVALLQGVQGPQALKITAAPQRKRKKKKKRYKR